MKYSRMDKDRLIYEHDKLIGYLQLLENQLRKAGIKITKEERLEGWRC